jgi:hypothetical protein
VVFAGEGVPEELSKRSRILVTLDFCCGGEVADDVGAPPRISLRRSRLPLPPTGLEAGRLCR